MDIKFQKMTHGCVYTFNNGDQIATMDSPDKFILQKIREELDNIGSPGIRNGSVYFSMTLNNPTLKELDYEDGKREVYDQLKKLRGMEAHITDPKIKELFREVVYKDFNM